MTTISIPSDSHCLCIEHGQTFTSSMRKIHLGCPLHNTKMNEWHVRDNRSNYVDKNSAAFIALCKEKLPKKNLIFTIGLTGYVNVDRSVLDGSNCWCQDDTGRMIILVNGNLLFQRYQKGDILMLTTNGYSYSAILMAHLGMLKSVVENTAK